MKWPLMNTDERGYELVNCPNDSASESFSFARMLTHGGSIEPRPSGSGQMRKDSLLACYLRSSASISGPICFFL
jgi:hypothetical protein